MRVILQGEIGEPLVLTESADEVVVSPGFIEVEGKVVARTDGQHWIVEEPELTGGETILIVP